MRYSQPTIASNEVSVKLIQGSSPSSKGGDTCHDSGGTSSPYTTGAYEVDE